MYLEDVYLACPWTLPIRPQHKFPFITIDNAEIMANAL